jgi:hypothetical protein
MKNNKVALTGILFTTTSYLFYVLLLLLFITLDLPQSSSKGNLSRPVRSEPSNLSHHGK